MIKSIGDYIFETTKNGLTFDVIDNKDVNIHGHIYTLKELFNNYTDFIEYAFIIYYKHKLKYYPKQNKYEICGGQDDGKPYSPNVNKLLFKTIKVYPEFITGLEIEHKMKTIKGAVEHEVKDNILYILDIHDQVLDFYKIDVKTGKLK